MNATKLFHFSFEDDSHSMHITATAYQAVSDPGLSYLRVSFHNTLRDAPLTVVAPLTVPDAMALAIKKRDEYVRGLIRYLA